MVDRNQNQDEANHNAAALAELERSIAAAPLAIEPRIRLGDLLLKQGRRGAAMEAYKQAIDRDRVLRALCRDVRQLLSEEARSTAQLDNCRHILARYPNYAPAHYGMACALLNLGRTTEACRAAERALVIDATVPTYYHVLIHAGNSKQKANALSAMEQLAQHETALEELDRATLHFLMAKAFDDRQQSAEAFVHLKAANAIKRTLVVYDEDREIGRMRAIAAAFTPARFESLAGAGFASPLPIFVIGMPRSGTTLVEQILASHPEAHGAGELTALPGLVASGAAGPDFPTEFLHVTAGQLTHLGEAYVGKIAAIAPTAKRIVDKLPYNFLYAGLIRLALPDARIIHVSRDPLDTCFSCFQQSFAGDVGFAYDLGELGRYYRGYEALMGHWRDVLPGGSMLEVRYEELVDDLPRTARRMIEFCGLDWDERCLAFHENRRAVATASLVQVRQPVYRNAIGRAQAYRDELAPLREALGQD